MYVLVYSTGMVRAGRLSKIGSGFYSIAFTTTGLGWRLDLKKGKGLTAGIDNLIYALSLHLAFPKHCAYILVPVLFQHWLFLMRRESHTYLPHTASQMLSHRTE